MKRTTPITHALTTNCTIVESIADIQTIRGIFDYFPNRFLPVVSGLEFVGVILRDEFFQKFLLNHDGTLLAKDLISKEMVKLSDRNTMSDALEVFDTKVFDVLPVTDIDGDLVGVLLREDVEAFFREHPVQAPSPLAAGLRKILSFLSL